MQTIIISAIAGFIVLATLSLWITVSQYVAASKHFRRPILHIDMALFFAFTRGMIGLVVGSIIGAAINYF